MKICWADRNWLCALDSCELDCPVRARARFKLEYEGAKTKGKAG